MSKGLVWEEVSYLSAILFGPHCQMGHEFLHGTGCTVPEAATKPHNILHRAKINNLRHVGRCQHAVGGVGGLWGGVVSVIRVVVGW